MNVAIEMRFEILKLAIKLATDTNQDAVTVYRSLIVALAEEKEETTKLLAEQTKKLVSE